MTFRKGDYYRYLAEFKTGNERKEAADQSLKAYQVYHKPTCTCPMREFSVSLAFSSKNLGFLVDAFLRSGTVCSISVSEFKPLINVGTNSFWLQIMCRLRQALP